MRTNRLLLLVVLLAAVGLAGCNREPKPDHEGVFVITEKQIAELTPIALETDFTDEGFALRYFSGEPSVKFKSGTSYFILSGDYRPVDIIPFRNAGARFEEDGTKADIRGSLQVAGMAGEQSMYKSQVSRHLPIGSYLLQVQTGGDQLFYAFRAE